jgi:hypothetical protein
MRKIIEKGNSKWILLFLLTVLSLEIQAQYSENEDGTFKWGNGQLDAVIIKVKITQAISAGTSLGWSSFRQLNTSYQWGLGDSDLLRIVQEVIDEQPPTTSRCLLSSCPKGYELIDCECFEKQPCVTECKSGYSQNSETCKCDLLPPCFGTTVEGLIPNGTDNKNELVEALKTMVSSFFAESDLLETMKRIGVLNPKELSTGFDNYIDGADFVDKISVGFTALDYNNNPTTENFMKIFVEGALLLLPPPASLGYAVLDTLYQKYFDGKSFADTLAKKMADKSADLFDCDLGSGVYGLYH